MGYVSWEQRVWMDGSFVKLATPTLPPAPCSLLPAHVNESLFHLIWLSIGQYVLPKGDQFQQQQKQPSVLYDNGFGNQDKGRLEGAQMCLLYPLMYS